MPLTGNLTGNRIRVKPFGPLMRRFHDGKRRYGSGTVKLRSDGRWAGQLRLADGSRRSVYAPSRERVIARLQEERWRPTWGIPIRARGLLLGEYLRQWLAVARTRLLPRTVESYDLCSRRIARELGQVLLARISPQMVQGAYAHMLGRGSLSARCSRPTLCSTARSGRHTGPGGELVSLASRDGGVDDSGP